MKNALIKPVLKAGVLAVLTAGLILPMTRVSAQNIDNFEGAEAKKPTTVFDVSVGTTYRTETEVDTGGDPEFSVFGIRVGGGGTFQLSEQLMLNTGANYEYAGYDWSGVSADPWEDIHFWRFRALLSYALDQNWRIYGGPAFTLSGESGADFGHSFAGGGVVGFNYIVDENLAVGLVGGVFSVVEDDPAAFVFPTLHWMFADDWNLQLGYTALGSGGGLGAELSYILNTQWRLALGAQYQKRRFLADDDGRDPSFHDGVGQDTSVPVYLKAVWKTTPQLDVEGYVGVTAGGELRAENSRGNRIFEEDYDPSAQIGLQAVMRF